MKLKSIILLALLFLAFPGRALAVCPVCTVAVGAGLGLCRFLGIDDTISGIWVGGLILSSGLWLADFLTKKNLKLTHLNFWSVVLFYIFVLPPLYWAKMIGIAGNAFWGVDKLLLGVGLGSILFLFGVWTDKTLRRTNDGKVYIYYQKVIIPVFYLTIASYIFYLITC
jgi:hypothetical protein